MVNTMNDVRGHSRMGQALHLIRIINPAHFRKGILRCRIGMRSKRPPWKVDWVVNLLPVITLK